MNYLIAVLPDRIKAEEAYTALEKAGFPQQQLSILGKGYRTADEFGLADPVEQGKQRALQMAIWLVPFGFASGYLFDQITGLDTFAWAGTPGNHIIGGLAGAIGGAMGSVFVGGGVGLTLGSGGEALPYRNRLKAGKYLVVVKELTHKKQEAEAILKRFTPESIQAYGDAPGRYT